MASVIDNLASNILGNVGTTLENSFTLTSILPEITEIKDTARELKILNTTLGNINKSTKSLSGNINSVVKSTGLLKSELVGVSRAAAQYNKILSTSMLRSTGMFQEATQMNAETLGDFIGKLTSLGKISDESSEAMFSTILRTREAYGLSNDSMNSLTESILNYASTIKTANVANEQVISGMTIFASKIRSVGFEAEYATDLIDKMINPDRIEDNLMLLSRLGISMQDAMFGDPLADGKIEKSLEKLQKLAKDTVANPNRIVANEIAKIYGMTYNEMVKLSKMDLSKDTIDQTKKLEQYRQDVQTAFEGATQIKETILGVVAEAGNKVAKIFSPLYEAIGPKGLAYALIASSGLIIKGISSITDKVRYSLTRTTTNIFADALEESFSRVSKKKQAMSQLSSGITAAGANKVDVETSNRQFSALMGYNMKNRNPYQKDFYNDAYQSRLSKNQSANTETIQKMIEQTLSKRTELETYKNTLGNSEWEQRRATGIENLTDKLDNNLKNLYNSKEGNKIFNDMVNKSTDALRESEINREYTKDLLGKLQAQSEILRNTDPAKYLELQEPLNSLRNQLAEENSIVARNTKEMETLTAIQKRSGEELSLSNRQLRSATAAIAKAEKKLARREQYGLSADASKLQVFGAMAGSGIKSVAGSIGGALKSSMKFGLQGMAIGAAIGIVGKLGGALMDGLKKNEKFQELQESWQKVRARVADTITGWITKLVGFLEKPMNALSNFLAKISKEDKKKEQGNTENSLREYQMAYTTSEFLQQNKFYKTVDDLFDAVKENLDANKKTADATTTEARNSLNNSKNNTSVAFA